MQEAYRQQEFEQSSLSSTLYLTHLRTAIVYTGLTRAKQLAIMVGSEKAVRQHSLREIAIAVKQLKQQQRYTRLQQRLLA